MEIKPQYGIGQLLFGMKQRDVEAICGTPDKQFRDDDQNIIYLYNQQQLRLTFYEDEGFRFGYAISSNPDLTISGTKIIALPVGSVKQALEKHFKTWETEDFDMTVNDFNEANWLILQSEFGLITKVEMGVVAKNMDDFDWKFQSK